MAKVEELIIGVLSFLIGIVVFADEAHLAEYFLNIVEFIIKSVIAITPHTPQTQPIFFRILLSITITRIAVSMLGICLSVIGFLEIIKGFKDGE